MKPKKGIGILVSIILLLFIYYSINAAPLISDEEYTYLGELKWYHTYDEGIQVAMEENKPMLVYFWAIWCTFCKKLHEEVYPNPEVNEILENDFVLVAVDLDVNREDAQKFGVQFPPYLIFFTPSGEIITRVPGYTSTGDFLPILTTVRDFTTQEMLAEIHGDLPQTRTGPS